MAQVDVAATSASGTDGAVAAGMSERTALVPSPLSRLCDFDAIGFDADSIWRFHHCCPSKTITYVTAESRPYWRNCCQNFPFQKADRLVTSESLDLSSAPPIKLNTQPSMCNTYSPCRTVRRKLRTKQHINDHLSSANMRREQHMLDM